MSSDHYISRVQCSSEILAEPEITQLGRCAIANALASYSVSMTSSFSLLSSGMAVAFLLATWDMLSAMTIENEFRIP